MSEQLQNQPGELPYAETLVSSLQTPEDYKVCVVCGHVVEKLIDTCSHCGAYRFEADPSLVSNTALTHLTNSRSCISDFGELDDD